MGRSKREDTGFEFDEERIFPEMPEDIEDDNPIEDDFNDMGVDLDDWNDEDEDLDNDNDNDLGYEL